MNEIHQRKTPTANSFVANQTLPTVTALHMLRILLMVKPDHHILMLRLQEPWQVTMVQPPKHNCMHMVVTTVFPCLPMQS